MTCGTSGRPWLSASLSFLVLGSVVLGVGPGIGVDDDEAAVVGGGGGGGAEALGTAVGPTPGVAMGVDPLLSPTWGAVGGRV